MVPELSGIPVVKLRELTGHQFMEYTTNKAITIFEFGMRSTSMLYDTLSALTIMCRVTKKEKKD